MASTLRRLLVIVLLVMLAPAAHAAAKPNPHNSSDCLFCHGATPKFGLDTRATVTFTGSTWDDPALCLRCHKPEENLHPLKVKPGAAAGMTAPADLALGRSPGLEGTVVCVTCHFVHAADADHALLDGFPGSQRPALFTSWQDLCRECHGTSLAKRSPHAGDEKTCVFCHQATPKKGQPAMVTQRGEALCNFCHGGMQNKHFEKANPFSGEVTCSTCHDPHLGTDHPGRLKASFLEAARVQVTIDPHYRKTLCFTCHKEEQGAPLLTADANALCNRCHGTGQIPGDPHPLVKVPPGMTIPAGWPLRDGSVTCSTCHRAGHREDRPFYRFLRGGPYRDRNDVCFQCHSKEEFAKRNPHKDINQLKGCEFCHAVRPVPGKDNAKTVKLLADVVILCLRCHDYTPHPAAFQHTIKLDTEWAGKIPAELPLNQNGEITCSTCHNPHIEEVENRKLRGGMTGMEICGQCHRM